MLDIPTIGHNGGPSIKPRNFKRQWAQALFSRQDKPSGAVAMAFKLYMEMDAQGRGAVISDLDFVMACGVSDRSVRTFKKWLIDEGYISVSVKGARGRQSEFFATIPGPKIAATDAGIQRLLPARIAGNSTDHRQPLPETIAGNPGIPATDAGIPSPIPATITGNSELPATGAGIPSRVDDNIYNKNNNNNLTLSHQEPARESEQHVGHGVYVNCETVRHEHFSISIPGVAYRCQASGLSTDEIKSKIIGSALQWAVEIENGKSPSEVVPKVIVSALARTVMNDHFQAEVHHTRKQKASGAVNLSREDAKRKIDAIVGRRT